MANEHLNQLFSELEEEQNLLIRDHPQRDPWDEEYDAFDYWGYKRPFDFNSMSNSQK